MEGKQNVFFGVKGCRHLFHCCGITTSEAGMTSLVIDQEKTRYRLWLMLMIVKKMEARR
jgi:hypothetical protein